MAVADNVYNEQLKRWEDPVNKNWMDPVTGLWNDPRGFQWNPTTLTWDNPAMTNGVQRIGQPQAQSQFSQNSGQPAGSYNPQAGYGWEMLNMDYAFKQAQQQLQGNQAKELAGIENQYKMQMQQADSQIKLMLAQKQIDADTANLMKNLAQRESEFARNLALEQAKFTHQQQQDQLSQEIARAAEMRQERTLQANLSANPTDWVNYQFYKRGLTDPSMNPSAASGLSTTQPTMINGQPYSPSAPASSDQQIQTMATALFAPPSSAIGQAGTTLGGTGAFGTKIPNPGQFSRGTAANSSDTDLAMISGLLRAGVDYSGNGQRTALDPNEWFKTAEKWWIPTAAESGGIGSGTKYS